MTKHVTCIIVDDEAVARDIIASHISKIDNIEIAMQCKNAIEAFNFISNNKVDLVFLDINMPEISGIAFAKSINKDIKIIFTTAYRDYAVEGFDLQAVDYLLKPISFERLLQAVNRYFEVTSSINEYALEPSESNDFIFVRSDRRMIKIDFDSILYIESYSDYIKIHLEGETIVTRETISAMEAKLPKQNFIRIHRSYIIALSKIQSFNSEGVTLNRRTLPFSRSYRKEVLKLLENY
ncbi:response regulator transcription factor [Winogradskyella echinorum]|uniref:Response regulator transcription factor n=1 Tax=Winogradskyella echinorum TaxID=538189 RepID=A0ABR6Y5J0_9FLAO|nr:LytTR family DNA-binding domain-containing protein [Winogradskyella echinorum]MBC3847964.1 response regulator transcription factor [Winogradskyella echinorum]MBC5752312.1 response regulator transcription factor [Winogradskyella echinorum]